MKTVYKYNLNYGVTQLALPEDATPLHVAVQGRETPLWVLLDPKAPTVPRSFGICPTGGEVPDNALHISTFLIEGGRFVFHAFELVN